MSGKRKKSLGQRLHARTKQRSGGASFVSTLTVLGLVLVTFGFVSAPAQATGGSHGGPSKAAICKYVGTPGVNERLQTGNNPIVVDRKDWMQIGSYFQDGQGRSYVLSFLNPGDPEPSVNDCPPPTEPPTDACPDLDGNQPPGTDCTQPADDRETRDLPGVVNCQSDTHTVEHQERTREYSWDGDSWEPSSWSDWTTYDTTVTDATDEQCPEEPPTDACPDLDGNQPPGTDCTQPADDRETRKITGDPDCDTLTVTSWTEERTRSYVWDSGQNKWVAGQWSDWTKVQGSETVKDANGQQCDFYISTSHTVACGTATITLVNHTPWVYPVSYRIDNDDVIGSPDTTGPYGPVVNNLGAAPNHQSGSKTFTFDEDSGTHTIRYAVRAGTESNLWRDQPAGEEKTITVETNCQPDLVTPPKPKWTDPCGLDNGSWSYEDGEGYRYEETVNPDGSITVTIVAEEGYTFPADFKTRYTKKDSGELCPVTPVNPTVTQAECTGPGQSTEPSIMPADSPEQIDYEIVGQTVIASVNDSDYEIVLPDGSEWVLNADGTATYNVVFDTLDCTVEATPVAFDISQPTCNTDGQLTVPEQPTGVMVTPAAGTYGPGDYEVIFSALEGYVLTDNPSGVISVLAATGYQDADPKAVCYVERKPDERTTSSERESCKLGGVETTTTVHTTSWEFNEATQKWEPVKTATSSQSFEPYTGAQLAKCDKEPPTTPGNPTFNTGLAGDEDGPAPAAPYGLIALLVLGLALIGSPHLARIRRR